MHRLSIDDEYSDLKSVIIGRGTPYQRDKSKAAREITQFPQVPDTPRRNEVMALTYPTEADLIAEYDGYVSRLRQYDIEVLFANPEAAYSFDYTCPRDIGFVIGPYFFIANMAVASRAREIETITTHLHGIDPANIVRPPSDCLLEGGDVIVWNKHTLLVGYHQRSNRLGAEFLKKFLTPLGYRVIPVPHRQLHLDCCLNPLGLGHLLIHPQSLINPTAEAISLLQEKTWVEVNAIEREHLATNVLSIKPDTIIARDHRSCHRVNHRLAQLGYTMETVTFDGVPATGGSFRCASLPLLRH